MKHKQTPKRILPFLALCLLGLTLSGCVENRVGVTLDGQGGGEVVYTMRASKTAIDSYLGDRSLPEGLTVETVGGEDCYSQTIRKTCANAGELEAAIRSIYLFDTGAETLFREVTIDPCRIHLSTRPSPLSQDVHDLVAADGVDLYDYLTLDLTVTMPTKIVACTGGRVSSDGRSVTVTVEDLREPFSLTVECAETIPLGTVILIALGGATLLAGLAMGSVALIRHRNRKRAEAMPDVPVDVADVHVHDSKNPGL